MRRAHIYLDDEAAEAYDKLPLRERSRVVRDALIAAAKSTPTLHEAGEYMQLAYNLIQEVANAQVLERDERIALGKEVAGIAKMLKRQTQ